MPIFFVAFRFNYLKKLVMCEPMKTLPSRRNDHFNLNLKKIYQIKLEYLSANVLCGVSFQLSWLYVNPPSRRNSLRSFCDVESKPASFFYFFFCKLRPLHKFSTTRRCCLPAHSVLILLNLNSKLPTYIENIYFSKFYIIGIKINRYTL